jgi:predicted ferric reductase
MRRRTNVFGLLLYIAAIILVIVWAVNYFFYNAGDIIHILLIIAIIAVLVRVIRDDTL